MSRILKCDGLHAHWVKDRAQGMKEEGGHMGRAVHEVVKLILNTLTYIRQPEVNMTGKNPEDFGLINQGGLSRKHIFDSVEASLRRLQLDYIDLYQYEYKVHAFAHQYRRMVERKILICYFNLEFTALIIIHQ